MMISIANGLRVNMKTMPVYSKSNQIQKTHQNISKSHFPFKNVNRYQMKCINNLM